jgi:hypothetical protein
LPSSCSEYKSFSNEAGAKAISLERKPAYEKTCVAKSIRVCPIALSQCKNRSLAGVNIIPDEQARKKSLLCCIS